MKRAVVLVALLVAAPALAKGLPPLHRTTTTSTLPCVKPGAPKQPLTGLPECPPKKAATKGKRRKLRRREHARKTTPSTSLP